MINDKEFQRAAALLKRVSPTDEWENFLGAFRAYTFTTIGAVADASSDAVVMHQGFARQCKKLLILLEECETATKDKP